MSSSPRYNRIVPPPPSQDISKPVRRRRRSREEKSGATVGSFLGGIAGLQPGIVGEGRIKALRTSPGVGSFLRQTGGSLAGGALGAVAGGAVGYGIHRLRKYFKSKKPRQRSFQPVRRVQ